VNTATVVAVAAAALAAAAAGLLAYRSWTLGKAIDSAIDRIGNPEGSAGRRIAALDRALARLEASTAQAQRERARLAGAVQAAPIGIVITDDHGIVLASNQVAEEMTGSGAGEAVPQEGLAKVIERAVLERAVKTENVELFAPSRTVLEVTALPLDFGVESAGTVAFLTDATEGRRIAAVRRDFVSNVAHRLKNPLGSLAALGEALAELVPRDKTTQDLAARLKDQAGRLAEMIGDLLDLSQAEALTAQLDPISIGEVLDAIAAEAGELAKTGGVQLSLGKAPRSARVTGDARQLSRMVYKLIENAVTHADAESVKVVTTIDGGALEIAVSDDGVGIDPEHIGRVFERFYRVDGDDPEGGAGLGLSIARHIARSHGGDVTVTSSVGEGTTFTVRLPIWSST
jgi:signal transduction histidine kinase